MDRVVLVGQRAALAARAGLANAVETVREAFCPPFAIAPARLLNSERIMPSRVLIAPLAALTILAGCASPAGEADENERPLTQAEADRIAARASEHASEPGEEVFTATSSLPGATTWTAYLGAGITVIGTDEAGARRAMLSWVLDGENVEGVTCAMPDASAEACSSALRTMVSDLRAASSTVGPASVHILRASLACERDIRSALLDAESRSFPSVFTQGRPPATVTCDRTWCDLYVSGRAYQLRPSLAAECCPKAEDRPEYVGSLVGYSTTLICRSGKGTSAQHGR